MNQNYIHKEVKNRLNLGNTCCYHSFQSLILSSLLSKNLNIKIYKSIILPVTLCRHKTSFHIIREDHRLKCWSIGIKKSIWT